MTITLKFPVTCIMEYISLLWLLLFWCALCDANLDLQVKNFDCFNDYEKYSFCSWDVFSTSKINCSDEFLLRYILMNENSNISPVNQTCIPEDIHLDDILPKQCICHLDIKIFLASIEYYIELKSHGKPVLHKIFTLMQKVKPIAPFNLTVDISDSDNVFLAWEPEYKMDHHLYGSMCFQVQVMSKQNQKEVKNFTLKQVEAHYHMNKRHFRRGHQYMVKVRSQPNGDKYNGTWSEWSHAAEWYNDYSLSVQDLMKIIIPVVTTTILLLVLSYHFGIKNFKKKWLEKTPDPAESKLFVRKHHMQQKRLLHSEWNHNRPKEEDRKQNVCGNWFHKLIAKVPTEYDLHVSDTLCAVLQPEIPTIEREFEVYYVGNENNTEKFVLEEGIVEEDGGLLPQQIDESVQSTLLKIVAESDFMFDELVLDNVDNHEGQLAPSSWGGFSFFREVWKPENTQVEMNENSPESGYHSYEGNNSPVELQNKTGQLELFNFNECSWGLDHLQFNAPIENLKNSSDVCQPVALMDSGYNAFANVVSGSEYQPDFASSTRCKSPALSWDSEKFPMSTQINSNHRLQPFVEYYNRNASLLLSEVSPIKMYNQITLKPNRYSHSNPDECNYEDEIEHDIDDTYPTSKEFPGYQSFSEAIQQEGQSIGCPVQVIDCAVLDSGYKPFNCLLNENKNEVDNDNCLIDVDMGIHPEEPFQEDTESLNINVDNYDEPKLAKEHCFSFPNFLFSEACTDDPENDNPPDTVDSSEQVKDDGSKIMDIKNNTTINSQDENIGTVPYALTFDICNHLWNLANLYGDNLSLGTLKPLGLVDFNLNDTTSGIVSYCPDNIKSCLSTYGSTKMTEEEFSFIQFLKHPKHQETTFENMSYFHSPYSLRTLLSDTQEDSSVMPSNLLVSHKLLDKDGNSYMKLALSNTQHLESVCTVGKY